TYTGATTISAGTLQVGNGGATGTLGTGNVVNNATLSYFLSGNSTLNYVISGTGNLFQEGSGVLTLAAANTYTGTTNVDNGTLRAGVNNAIGSGSVVSTQSTLDLNGFNDTIAGLTNFG